MLRSNYRKWFTGPPLVVAWLIAVLVGMGGLLRYQMTPGVLAATTPVQWPASASFSHNPKIATLVMTLHPQCPCSRASVHELAELISRSEGRLDVRVLFIQPTGAPPDWLDGALWAEAKALPHTTVRVDKDGKDAAAFGATTSGQVALYDAAGNLKFRGGITDGRGHEGDNAGYLSVLEYIRIGKSPTASAPVYGCSLGVCKVKPNQGKGS